MRQLRDVAHADRSAIAEGIRRFPSFEGSSRNCSSRRNCTSYWLSPCLIVVTFFAANQRAQIRPRGNRWRRRDRPRGRDRQ